MGLKPFREVPRDLREWTKWMRAQIIPEGDDYALVDHTHADTSTSRSTKIWTFESPAGSTGVFFFGGSYQFHSAAFTPAGGTNVGTANASYAAHALVVLGATSVDMVVSVTGTSITDNGVRTAADTENIVTTGGSANDYFETKKKWIGQVSYALDSGTGAIINAGFAKYWDFANTNFTVVALEALWLGAATDAGFNMQLIHHKNTGWTYGAGGDPTFPTPIADMNVDHVTEISVINGEEGAWKRVNLSVPVRGAASEGILFCITTTANKAIEIGNLEVTVTS